MLKIMWAITLALLGIWGAYCLWMAHKLNKEALCQH